MLQYFFQLRHLLTFTVLMEVWVHATSLTQNAALVLPPPPSSAGVALCWPLHYHPDWQHLQCVLHSNYVERKTQHMLEKCQHFTQGNWQFSSVLLSMLLFFRNFCSSWVRCASEIWSRGLTVSYMHSSFFLTVWCFLAAQTLWVREFERLATFSSLGKGANWMWPECKMALGTWS